MNIFKKIFGNNQNDKKEVITMTNTEKAIALINTFATGDTEKASELLAENYIQHNLAYGTGRDAFVGSVSYLASAPVKTTVNNIRAFEDGDKVFLQTVYNFAGVGEQVAFGHFPLRRKRQDCRTLGQPCKQGRAEPVRSHANRRHYGNQRP